MAFGGNPPVDLGLIDLDPKEMMFWMYCPIKNRGVQHIYLPDNLEQFRPIVTAAFNDFYFNVDHNLNDYFIYLTAKTLWVSGDYIGNRPGWHIDGFGTNDINYIWSDRAPTEFIVGDFELSSDCDQSMVDMKHHYIKSYWSKQIPPLTFPNKHLLRLDNKVIHRSPVSSEPGPHRSKVLFEPGMRTFVKVSISKDPYDLEGNSINHKLGDIFADKRVRNLDRNHPQALT